MKVRTPIVWKCQNSDGAGLRWGELKAACGRYHAMNTTFNPDVGGNRNHRWIAKCKFCGKKTALNPERGNVLQIRPPTIADAKMIAEQYNRDLGLV